MTAPTDHPDLLALLRGELTNREILEASDHLDECEECRRELTPTITGHALITSSARTLAPESPRPVPVEQDRALPALPPLREMPPMARTRNRIAAGLAAAAVVAAAWTGGYVVADRPGERPPVAVPPTSDTPAPTPTGTTVSAVLTPVEGTAGGTVRMTEHGDTAEMTIETDHLRPARRGEFYYAWLLDPETNKMLPLGQVGPGGTASFEVTPALLAAYSAVDVSLESDDGDPGHSPRSVLRAVYA
ncbi:anti-sigma factor [Nocardioides currus]|uniref:Anti-sigma K factor RskA C-terminal domain-containing protein n=1 Tax=Nocardioides currus TaxID=2133958 RepID=A0A2R7YZL8_9ACTN|nr:anti-sigma factor [Nocardioides currus]PUA81764.1 hypothetical protein C7S10_06770 [Nocardioides currus]